MSALALEVRGRTDAGRRPNNEDAWFASPKVVAVADGVGGAAAGEVASATIVNALIHLDKCRLQAPLERALAESVAWGNETIGFIAACRPQLTGMSTTLTAAALSNDGRYVIANVGDSRTYLLRGGTLRALTRDQSLVQKLLDTGAITDAEARRHPQRSLVLEALDGDPARRPALVTVPARAGDRLLLCSDGLSDVLDDAAIAAVLTVRDRRACVDGLVERALAAGARDNVTAVVADVVPRGGAATAWQA
jgi:serine/threonine protein phosphatase PrpC